MAEINVQEPTKDNHEGEHQIEVTEISQESLPLGSKADHKIFISGTTIVVDSDNHGKPPSDVCFISSNRLYRYVFYFDSI